MVQKTINLCFVYPEGDGWTGEANYLDSLISSLSLLKLNKLNFLIFCSYKKKNIYLALSPKKILLHPFILKKIPFFCF